HALTHQELDDVDAAHGHPVGQVADGDDGGDDHFARTVRRIGRAALALFLLAFASPADRGQRAHPFGGVHVSSGHGLDGQAAFTTLRLAARAADGLAGTGIRETLVAIVIAAGAGGTAETGADRTGHGRLGGRLVRAGTAAGAGARTARTGGAGSRTRVQGRIADRFGRAGRTAGALRTVGVVALAAAHGGFARRTTAEGRRLRTLGRGLGLGHALAEIDHRAGRRGRTGRSGRGRRSGGLGRGRGPGLGRFGGLGGRLGRRSGGQLGGFVAGGFGRGLGGGGLGLGGAGGAGGGGGLLTGGGLAA